jgi:DNA-binding beta-propeller fold protein YncE
MKKIILICFMFAALSLLAETAYVLNSNSQTLSEINLENGEINNNFASLGQYAASAPNKMELAGDFAYVTITYENSLQKIDLTSGESIDFIALEDSALPNDLAILDNFAYISGNGNSTLYRVDLAAGNWDSSVEVGLSPQAVEVIGGNIWVANTGFDLSTYTYEPGTISVVDPETMNIITTIETGLNPAAMVEVADLIHVVCTGDYADVAGEISVIDKQSFQVIETINLGGAPATIAAKDEKLYIGNSWPAGIYIYDISVGTIESTPAENNLAGGSAVAFGDNYLAIIDAVDYVENSRLRLYDLETYDLIADYEAAVGATDLKLAFGNTAAAEDIVISPYQMSNYPNPFNPNKTGRAGVTTISYDLPENAKNPLLKIYNSKGQKIITLGSAEQSIHGRQAKTTWDGKDRQHNPVAAGIYLYQLQIDGQTVAWDKMILVK